MTESIIGMPALGGTRATPKTIGGSLHPLEEQDDVFKFTLSNLNVSMANALRRTIQDDIPCYVFDIDTCQVEVNTGRLHNEILKQRLQCIPIHVKVGVKDWLEKTEGHNLFEKYIVEVDIQNDTDSVIYITTGDFRIKNKDTGRLLTDVEHDRIFPKDRITNSHIIFSRLRPRISDTIPGEHLKFTCGFKISTANENSSFTAVSCSSYGYTVDNEKARAEWERIEAGLRSDGIDKEEIDFRKKNFDILDRQRHFVPDSFDFTVETIGTYTPRELCKNACIQLQWQFKKLEMDVESDNVTILNSETTMENCYDFILERGDYTLGKVLEWLFYSNGFVETQKGVEPHIKYCGFKKFHPHDEHSTLRVAYNSTAADKGWMKTHLKQMCSEAAWFYSELKEKF